MATLEAGFLNALTNAVAGGELKATIDITGWSRKLATMLLGMMVLIRARVDPSLAREVAGVAISELRAYAASGEPRLI